MARWSRRRCSLLAALAAAACSSGSEAPRVTDIAVTPAAVSLASIGATQQMTATVRDQNGNVMTGQAVTWSSTNAASATVGVATGLVTAVANGTTSVGAAIGTVVSPGVTVTVAQAPASLTKQGGDGQSGITSTALGTPITVRVADAGGVAIAGAIATFTPAAGSGSVSQTADTTGASGLAQVTWTLGASGGAQSVTVSVPTGGAPLTTTFGATAVAPGVPTSITALTVTSQTALVGAATNSRPAVVVRDAANAVVVGAIVTFAVTGGGGTPTKPIDTTDANGVAQVGAWTVGAAPGANTMTATVAALTPVAFTATAQAALYNLEIRNIGPALSTEAAAALAAAEAYWEQIIYGELSNVPINTADACGLGATISETVDDLIILARFDSIDGPSNAIGRASPCSIRVSNGLPIYGYMVFDSADVTLMSNLGILSSTMLHEIGHIIGFTDLIWNSQPGITNPVTCAANVPRDPNTFAGTAGLDSHFTCAGARAAFDSIGGGTFSGGSKVPLENCTGLGATPCSLTGTIYAHWRETAFDKELMTGYADAGGEPVSIVTIASFGDIGYLVNYAAAQAYSQVFTVRSVTSRQAVPFGDDLLRLPVSVVDDTTGRVLRVIRP